MLCGSAATLRSRWTIPATTCNSVTMRGARMRSMRIAALMPTHLQPLPGGPNFASQISVNQPAANLVCSSQDEQAHHGHTTAHERPGTEEPSPEVARPLLRAGLEQHRGSHRAVQREGRVLAGLIHALLVQVADVDLDAAVVLRRDQLVGPRAAAASLGVSAGPPSPRRVNLVI